MANQIWSPDDGALLKKLREDAGVEIITLARLHSLSSTQVKQLENGGESSFYSPAIKLATGRKLLMHFGADLNPVQQEPEQFHDPEPELPTGEVYTAQKNNRNLEKNIFLWLQLAGVGGALIFLVYWSFFQPARVTKKEPLETRNLLSSASTTIAIAPETKPISSTLLFDAEIPNQSSSECIWDADSISVFGYQPTKSGDYVHVVATSDASICVKDATGKVQILHLKNSQSQTIRGKQPFELFSSNLIEFKLFYQGSLLRLPSSKTNNITLKEQQI